MSILINRKYFIVMNQKPLYILRFKQKFTFVYSVLYASYFTNLINPKNTIAYFSSLSKTFIKYKEVYGSL